MHENLFELRADLKERGVLARTIVEVLTCSGNCADSSQASHRSCDLTLHPVELLDEDGVESIQVFRELALAHRHLVLIHLPVFAHQRLLLQLLVGTCLCCGNLWLHFQHLMVHAGCLWLRLGGLRLRNSLLRPSLTLLLLFTRVTVHR